MNYHFVVFIKYNMNDYDELVDLGTTNQPTWLMQEERLQTVDSVFDRETMNSISFQFIYINTHDYIDKITCLEYDLTIKNGLSYLVKESLIRLIEQHKIKTATTKYKLEDVYLCNFDVLPSQIHDFTYSYTDKDNANNYIKEISSVDDIIINPSTFLFHDINTIYVIYREQETISSKHHTKSILKSPTDFENVNKSTKKTKKVRISLKPHHKNDDKENIYKSNKRTTKKNKKISIFSK